MDRFSPTARRLALVLVLALAARLVAAAWWESRVPPGERFGFGDSESYWQLGRAIAEGRPYAWGEAHVFRTPGYPLMLAGLFRATGERASVAWARVLSALLSTAAVGGVFWLGRELFDTKTGMLAALIAAVYPGQAALGGLVLSEAPFCALMILQIALWTKGWRAPSPRAAAWWMLAAGAAAGAATLVRPSWLLFTPFAVGVALLVSSQRMKHLASACWLIVGLCVVMSPWWVRNYRVTGHVVLTTLQVGASLYDGQHPGATGASDMQFVPKVIARFDNEHPNLAGAAREYELDRFMRAEAVDWARTNPGRAVQLAGIKFLRMWNVWPNEPQFRSMPVRILVLISYAPLIVLGLIGAWKFVRRGWPYALCLLPAVYFTLLHMVFVSSLRYREPPMLLLIVLAAGVVTTTGQKSRGWES